MGERAFTLCYPFGYTAARKQRATAIPQSDLFRNYEAVIVTSSDFRGNVLCCPLGCSNLQVFENEPGPFGLRVHFLCEKCSREDPMLGLRYPAHTLEIWSANGATHMAWAMGLYADEKHVPCSRPSSQLDGGDQRAEQQPAAGAWLP